jgi:membrane associated rhomboid family serine protease
MKLLDRLERSLRPYAIPNITAYLVLFQGVTFFMALARPDFVERLLLIHDKVFAGEWWRLISFVLTPPSVHPVFVIFQLFFFYFMGTALEMNWGTVRYNLFLLCGYLFTLPVVLIPGAIVSNIFISGSVFLAFAAFYPEYQIRLYLIIPVKVKWLAFLQCLVYLIVVLTGDLAQKAAVLASVVNVILFFHREIVQTFKTQARKSKGNMTRARAREEEAQPRHVCTTCGISDVTDRRAEFRYCPLCTGTPAYCLEHIANHVHR